MKHGIGIFDSGVGGLTVANEIRKLMPCEDIKYFGDLARVPYGNKSKDFIVLYAKKIANFLESKNIKILVIACNTATAHALYEVRKSLKIPVIGVVMPGSSAAVRTSKKKKICVIGTHGTIESLAYDNAIKIICKDASVHKQACPLFVPFIEEGYIEGEILEKVVSMYLENISAKVDTIILGCTHYPLIKNVIQKVVGDNVNLIDSAIEVSIRVKNILKERNDLSCDNLETGIINYYVSDNKTRFEKFVKLIMKTDIVNVEKINLD